jgi:ketosteroid isomerase-like protein
VTSASLDERIARQEAAEEVRALVSDYADACDAQDLAGIEAIVAPDIEVVVSRGTFTGLDAVLDFFRTAWAANPYPSRHFITNVAMRDLQADTVTATAYFLYVSSSGSDESKIGWGTYRDRYIRHDGRLRLQSKRIDMDLIVDVHEGWGTALRAARGRS